MINFETRNHSGIPMATTNVKAAAHQLIDQLPDGVTWDEVAYEIEVRASIERGLADSDSNRATPVEDSEPAKMKQVERVPRP